MLIINELSKRLEHAIIFEPIENIIPDQFQTKQFFIINELNKPVTEENINELAKLICQFSLKFSFVRMQLYNNAAFNKIQLHRHNNIYMRYQEYYKIQTDEVMYAWEVLIAKVAK